MIRLNTLQKGWIEQMRRGLINLRWSCLRWSRHKGLGGHFGYSCMRVKAHRICTWSPLGCRSLERRLPSKWKPKGIRWIDVFGGRKKDTWIFKGICWNVDWRDVILMISLSNATLATSSIRSRIILTEYWTSWGTVPPHDANICNSDCSLLDLLKVRRRRHGDYAPEILQFFRKLTPALYCLPDSLAIKEIVISRVILRSQNSHSVP